MKYEKNQKLRSEIIEGQGSFSLNGSSYDLNFLKNNIVEDCCYLETQIESCSKKVINDNQLKVGGK